MLCIVSVLGLRAQTDAEYAAANAEIQANGVYKIYTLSNGTTTGTTPYYLKSDGYLTDDASAAGQFTFDFQRSFGNFKMGAYRLNRFTNGGNSSSSSTLSADAQKHIIVSTSQNRVNWEAQVFFKNEDGYAIRSTNSTGTAWGASAFWSVVEDNDEDGLPNATYTFDTPPYVWQLEKVTDGDYSDVTMKFITNYNPVANADGWTATNGNRLNQWASNPINFDSGKNLAEMWNNQAGSLKQTLQNLPAGYYTLTAIACSRQGQTSTLSAGGYSAPLVQTDGSFNNTAGCQTWFNNGNGVSVLDFPVDASSNVEIGITTGTSGDAWTLWRAFYLTYNDEPVAMRKALETAKANANAALGNESYNVVTGYERTQLTASVAKTISETGTPSTDMAAYNDLIEEINQKLSDFTSAPKYYTQLAAENERAALFEIAAQTTESQSALSAVDAQAKAVYNYVTTNYNTIIDLGEWTKVNAGDMTSQHWDGTSTSSYNEQLEGWGGSTAWTTSYSQDIVLPAGDYVFKVAGRHSQYSTLELVVKKGDEVLGSVNDFPAGDTGRGIATDGTASFGDDATYANGGVGRGWQWRYVPFTIEEENATITISVEGGNPEEKQYQWLGFCNYTVQSAPSVAASTVAYNQAKEAAVAARDNDTYVNVQGTDRSGLVAAIEADKGTTIESIDAAAETLKNATTTFTAAKASWDKLVSTRAGVSSELPYASPAKKSELDVAVAAEVTGNAADAAAQANVIEQKNRLYVESNAMAEGVDGAEDKTSLITNPNADENADGWSGGFGRLTGEAFTQGDGTSAGGYFDKNGASSYTAEQTIENLAAGKYLLTITARAQSGVTDYKVKATNSSAVDATGDVTVVGNQGGVFGRGFNDASVEFLQKTDGNATIGITASHSGNFWLSFDRVRLVRLRDLTPEEAFVAATDEDYAALNEAINAHVIGFDKGEYAPYNNVEAVATIAAAKAIDLEANNSQEDVQAATAAITGATWTVNAAEVNAIYDGSFEADYSGQTGNINPTGWQRVKGAAADGYNVRYMNGSNAGLQATSSGKALFTKQSAYYGYADGYTMPLKANAYYKITFVYGGWGDCKKDGYVSMAAPDGSAVTLSASDLPVDATDADSNKDSWKSYEAIFQTGEAGDYVLGLRKKSCDTSGQSQYVYGDIKLVRATVEDFKPALLAEINTAKDIDVTANVGDGAFQIPSSAASALTTAISTAENVYEITVSIDEVIEAVAALKAAEVAYRNVELNTPDAEKVYNVINVTEGFTHKDCALTFLSASDADLSANTTSMSWEVASGSYYPQGVKFTAVDGTKNGYKMSYTRADGTEVFIGTGSGTGLGSDNSQIRPTTDINKALIVQVVATSTDKVWNLYNTAAKANIGANTNGTYGFYTANGNNASILIQEAVKNEVTLNIKAENKYGTLIVPFDAELEGAKAYSVNSVDANGKTLLLTGETTSLKANTPYIVYAESGVETTLSGVGAAYTDATYIDGWLTGVYEATPITAEFDGKYVLQKQGDIVGFYQIDTTADPSVTNQNIGANRAYLTAPAADVKAFFLGGTETAIQGVKSESENGAIYNMAGQRVSRAQKGIFIQNGRKMIVK